MYLGCWSHPGPGHHTVTSVQWHMDAMMIFEHLPQICLILFANWRGEDSLIAEVTSRQTETRENESEPSAENSVSVSDSKNLVESSGCPSPGPPGQDKGTIWWCCHSINNGRKAPETLLMKAKPNIYLIFLLRRTLAKLASSLPTLDAGWKWPM